ESQLSLLHILKDGPAGLKRLARWLRGLRQEKNNLYVYTAPPLFPFGNYFISLNYFNQAVLGFILRRLIRRMGFKDVLLWLYSINSSVLLKKMNEKASVYYCIDDFSSEINIPKRKKTMLFLEDLALTNAGTVFACTRALAGDRRKKRPDLHFIRNGVSFSSFDKKEGWPVPADLKDLPSPKIGFIGTLDSRIDTQLLRYLAQKRSGWQIVLIGKNLSRQDFKDCPNIRLLGWKKHDLLPAYIMGMDACIIPYRTDGFRAYIFPLKTLEYFACGKPVVSTYLPELEEFSDVVKLSRDKADFMRNLELSLKEPPATEKMKSISAALSWEGRIELISGIIAETLYKEKQD
ncbi:MAG: glycosyltransferase, partial [Candidatus Omnitrophota bacterium]|nr:glycosyltransferase [Candidatus Omnitrophota bacterium]